MTPSVYIKDQLFIRDNQLPGFALRITASGAKAFIMEKRIDGSVRRQTLGRYGTITTEQARGMAQQYLGQIAFGVAPIADKKTNQARKVSTIFSSTGPRHVHRSLASTARLT